MYDAAIAIPDTTLLSGIQHTEFEMWCKCVRRLLGWSAGELRDWPELYASGHTPRDAARLAVYGGGQGD